MAEIPVAVREALDAWLSDLTFGWGVSDAEAEQTKTLCRDAFLAGHQAALDAGARAGEERARAIAECIAIVQSEEELGGPMPPELWDRIRIKEQAADVCRAVVGATKTSIIAHLRALLPPAAPERGPGA